MYDEGFNVQECSFCETETLPHETQITLCLCSAKVRHTHILGMRQMLSALHTQ